MASLGENKVLRGFESMVRGRWNGSGILILILAFLYAGGGRLGQLAAIPPGLVSPIWPASGIALAALYIFGIRLWPGVWLGSFLVNYGVHLMLGSGATPFPWLTQSLMATGSSLGIVSAAWLLRQQPGDLFSRAREVIRFVLVGAVLSSAISATVGAASLLLGRRFEWSAFGETWVTWFLGDAVGVLVVAPLLLVWIRPLHPPLPEGRLLEAYPVFVLLMVTCVLVSSNRYPLFFVVIPFLVTAAFRYGRHGATLAIFVVSVISLLFTSSGVGPFGSALFSRNESLLLLQGFTGVMVLTTLTLAAVLAEREQKALEAKSHQTKTHQTELLLQEERFGKVKVQEQLRTAHIIQSSFDMISRQTPDGVILDVSDACVPLLGYVVSELTGRSIYELIHPDDVDEIRSLQTMLNRQKGISTLSYRIRRSTGNYIWFEAASRAILGEDGTIEEVVTVSRDVTERKHAEEHIEHQAYHDSLTNLPNRLLLEDRSAIALARAKRDGRMMAMMFLDLDRFKNVNDTLGHAIGDQALQAVASRLQGCIREADTLARIGGDEFIVLVADLMDEKDSIKVAQKIIDDMGKPFFIEGHEIFLGVSIGIALYPFDGMEVESLLHGADRAMYRAKLAGGNLFQFHAAAVSAQVVEMLSLETDLRHSIDRDQLEVLYQPQIDLKDGEIVAVEALVRWNHPKHGLLLPDRFISLAEDSRFITRLGAWVLERACRDLRCWRDKGFTRVRVSVNLSPVQFQDPLLVQTVMRALDESGIPPEALELEITETTVMKNAEEALEVLQKLKSMKIQIVIDDFGTGYSSLGYLQRFPVDCIKIDRSFVAAMESGRRERAIVSAIVALAHALDLRVVAEGAETEEQIRMLQNENCDLVQGFFFSRALTAGKLESFLASSLLETSPLFARATL